MPHSAYKITEIQELTCPKGAYKIRDIRERTCAPVTNKNLCHTLKMNKASQHLRRASDLLAFGGQKRKTPATNKVPLRIMIRLPPPQDNVSYKQNNDKLEKMILGHLEPINAYILVNFTVVHRQLSRQNRRPEIIVDFNMPNDDPTPESVHTELFDKLETTITSWCSEHFPGIVVKFEYSCWTDSIAPTAPSQPQHHPSHSTIPHTRSETFEN